MEQRLLRDQLLTFTVSLIDRVLIRCEEIPFVAAWLAEHNVAPYDIAIVTIEGDTLYEIRRDYTRVQFQVAPDLMR